MKDRVTGSAHTLRVEDVSIPYLIVSEARSRKIRIKADVEDGIIVSIPPQAKEVHAIRFVESQQEWIVRQWKKIEKQRVRFAPVLQPFLEKNTVTYLGRAYQLIVDVGQKHWPPVSIEDSAIVVHCVSADLAQKILERWYRQQARAVISGAIEIYRERMKVSYESLSIKDQKTRWGSCSSRGNLNFSWRLILAPKPVLDYVVVHELAHLREMNHSEKFWRIVDEICPDYKVQTKWLKDNGISMRV